MLNAQTAEPGMLKRGETIRNPSGDYGLVHGSRKQGQNTFWGAKGLFSPVELCGEYPNHCWDAIDLYYICNRLQNIKVEKGISRDRAVKPSLQKWSPVFLQDALGATHVIFTDAGHTGIDSLPKGQSNRAVSMEGEWKLKAAIFGREKRMLKIYLVQKNLAVFSLGICRVRM